MFGYQIPTKTFSLVKVLGGLSKTLNVANQLIPLYNQAKPMITNAKNMLGILKSFNSDPKTNNNKIIETNDYEIKKEESFNSSNFNNPTFFI